MITPEIAVTVVSPLWNKTGFDAGALARRAAFAAWTCADIPEILAGRDVEIGIVLADDETVRTLNREYRRKDSPTNVLSFATLDDPDYVHWVGMEADGPVSLGDTILSYETIFLEAESMNKPPQDHYVHILVHGLLHLLCYDHLLDEDAVKMETVEIRILKGLGIENPYDRA